METPNNDQLPGAKPKSSKKAAWIIGGIITAIVLISASQGSTPQPASQSTDLQTTGQSTFSTPDQPQASSTSDTSSDNSVKNTVPVTTAPQPTGCTNGTYVNSDGSTVCSPETSSTAPAGATAQCVDGTYSFSQHRSGTCSHHSGVAQWL